MDFPGTALFRFYAGLNDLATPQVPAWPKSGSERGECALTAHVVVSGARESTALEERARRIPGVSAAERTTGPGRYGGVQKSGRPEPVAILNFSNREAMVAHESRGNSGAAAQQMKPHEELRSMYLSKP